MSEKEFQQQVMTYAKLRGWKIVHFKKVRVKRPNGSTYWVTPYDGDEGFPDLVVAKNGLVIFAELKTDAGRLTEGQKCWLQHLRPSNERRIVTVWRPNNWDRIKLILDT